MGLRFSSGLQLGARLPLPMCTAADLLTTVQHTAATDTWAVDGLGGVRRLHDRQDEWGRRLPPSRFCHHFVWFDEDISLGEISLDLQEVRKRIPKY